MQGNMIWWNRSKSWDVWKRERPAYAELRCLCRRKYAINHEKCITIASLYLRYLILIIDAMYKIPISKENLACNQHSCNVAKESHKYDTVLPALNGSTRYQFWISMSLQYSKQYSPWPVHAWVYNHAKLRALDGGLEWQEIANIDIPSVFCHQATAWATAHACLRPSFPTKCSPCIFIPHTRKRLLDWPSTELRYYFRICLNPCVPDDKTRHHLQISFECS